MSRNPKKAGRLDTSKRAGSSARCKDCEPTSKRPAPHPGPRCATHHREITRARKQAAHARRVEDTYGLTGEQYWELYEIQGGACAICRRAKGTGRRKLAVDHDHETGEVRGLCCSPCNRDVLGHLRDDVEALQRAIDYLRNPPARKLRRDGLFRQS